MKVFYKTAGIAPADEGYAVTLDGRPIKTPGKRPFVLASQALADAIAAEWQAQRGEIDPASMPLMRLAATAIDRVADNRAETVSGTAAYAGSDLLCYRTEAPEELAARQAALWQPLLDWAALRFDAPLSVTAGVVAVAQPPSSVAALARVVEAVDLTTLTALADLTGLLGSLVLALAICEGRLGAETAADLAMLDELFQAERWGVDAEAAARRDSIRAEIAAATRFLSLHRDGSA
jgi:chaperone required for assembly of F1-ATPase